MVDRFAYLKTALAFILIFIGAKIVVADTFGLLKVQPGCPGRHLVLLLGGVAYSLWRTRGECDTCRGRGAGAPRLSLRRPAGSPAGRGAW